MVGESQEAEGIELVERIDQRFRELEQESERGCVIVAAAMLDDTLRTLLLARLVPSANSKDELLDGGSAPVSSFSSRIDLAYRVGCVTEPVRRSLHLIRKVRNEFAHASTPTDFATDSIRSRIVDLLEANKALIELHWNGVKSFLIAKAEFTDESDPSTRALKEMVQTLGHRAAFNRVAAMLVEFLLSSTSNQERLRFPMASDRG